MNYDVISADGHIDLIWLPPDLFTTNASAAMKERMPYVVDGPKGPEWTSIKGAKFGLVNGMGSAGREYVPGIIHRSDRMASTGLYDDGKKGIRRLTEVDLRLKDQDRDGVQAEVLYGVLGSSGRLNDPEAATRDAAHLQRLAPRLLQGRARPAGRPGQHPELRHGGVGRRGDALRQARRARLRHRQPARHDAAVGRASGSRCGKFGHETGIPLHFHTIGGRSPDTSKMPAHRAAPHRRRAHHRLPDAHEHHADGADLLAARPSAIPTSRS